jgi:hypothetical protein
VILALKVFEEIKRIKTNLKRKKIKIKNIKLRSPKRRTRKRKIRSQSQVLTRKVLVKSRRVTPAQKMILMRKKAITGVLEMQKLIMGLPIVYLMIQISGQIT